MTKALPSYWFFVVVLAAMTAASDPVSHTVQADEVRVGGTRFDLSRSDRAADGGDEKTPPEGSSYTMPNNYFGMHLLVTDGAPGTAGFKHLIWTRYLVGRWGYAKTLFFGITKETEGPEQSWVDYVELCYELELIPVVRLGGVWDGGWIAPEADGLGNYGSLARAIQRVVEGLPRSDKCPLYIEIWNEPNLAVEWSGRPNAAQYAFFFVQAAEAIQAIGDPRIRVLNGALSTEIEWVHKQCRAHPDFVNRFDIWSSHPYPQNLPPHVNFHAGNVPPGIFAGIDAYVPELEALAEHGLKNVRVMITETGYDLGNSAFADQGHPIINEYNRADYMMRAFRDYYPKWPEVVAVMPFQLSNEQWARFDWVHGDSGTNEDGSPTKPHYQYTAVAALAKPTDATGAISGTVTVDGLGSRLDGAKVNLHLHPVTVTTDPMGNFFLPKLSPARYGITISKHGFEDIETELDVESGKNTVFDTSLEANRLATLEGVVRSGDDRDEELEGVVIRLEPSGAKAVTDRRGKYEFEDVIPARYTLIAEEQGRHGYTVHDLEVGPGRRNEHDFVLGRRRASDAQNLLNNSSFEGGTGGGGKKDIGLSFEPKVPLPPEYPLGSARVDDGHAHSGRHAQMMKIRRDELVIRQITHYNTAQPGATYEAGVWVLTEADDESAAWISFDFASNEGTVIEQITSRKKLRGESDGWHWLEVRGVAPKGSERLSLNLHTKGPSGSAWFDDAYVGMVEVAGK